MPAEDIPAVNWEQQLKELKTKCQETSEDALSCGGRRRGALPTRLAAPGRDTDPSLTTLPHVWGPNL